MIDWSHSREYTDKFINVQGDRGRKAGLGHCYNLLYKEYLLPSKTILEIGTKQGGFIKFCKEQMDVYFVGVDLYTKEVPPLNKYWHGTASFNAMADEFYRGDAYSEAFLYWLEMLDLKSSFDLVIDDGPHTLKSQIWMISRSDQLINQHGVYICEDVWGIERAQEIIKHSPYREQTYIWDASKKTGRKDDICIVIDRKK